MNIQRIYILVLWVILLLLPSGAKAEITYTPALMGSLGLITTPSARMDKQGTIRLHTSTIDPYLHAHLGVQLDKNLYIGIHQTLETSDLNGRTDALYPGVDLKLRLLSENNYRPEIALGLQSAFGHKRMAGEYLVMSKRHKNFDFSGGMAWGRLGSAAHVKNPLKSISKHFGKARALDGDIANDLNHWFTGKNIGFFAGVEYFPAYFYPYLNDISIKAEWGADRYIAEKAALDYSAPNPWAIGINYHPKPWVNGNMALVGGDKVMASLTLQSPLSNWMPRYADAPEPKTLRPYRTGLALPQEMERSAQKENILLYNTKRSTGRVTSFIRANSHHSLPYQIGRASRHIANHAGKESEEIKINPYRYGLKGPSIKLMRTDLERALIHKQGSPQEIWRSAEINHEDENEEIPFLDRFRAPYLFKIPTHINLKWDNQIGLSEEDSGILYRTSLLLEGQQQISARVTRGMGLRVNVKDNLYHLHDYRPRAVLPVRGDVDRFAKRTLGLEKLFLSYMTTPAKDVHIALTSGYLEEMYWGFGAEILYRPFGKRFALGMELWEALKRDPDSSLNMNLTGDHLLTGHVKAFYEIPQTNLTAQLEVGRYLAEDIGGTFTLSQNFKQGAHIKAFVTATDQADFDVFGGTTHLYSGLELTLPFGNKRFTPKGSAIRLATMPMGRNTGQKLDNPVPLYKITEPFSMRHIADHWTEILD